MFLSFLLTAIGTNPVATAPGSVMNGSTPVAAMLALSFYTGSAVGDIPIALRVFQQPGALNLSVRMVA
jgi:hypothetical protein